MPIHDINYAYNNTGSVLTLNNTDIPPGEYTGILLDTDVYSNSAGDLLSNYTQGFVQLFDADMNEISGQDGFDSIINALNTINTKPAFMYLDGRDINISSGSLTNSSSSNLQDIISDLDTSINRKVTLGDFLTEDVVELDEHVYVGLRKASGEWVFKSVVDNGDISISYASVKNNPTVVSYGEALAGMTGLSFGNAQEAF